MNENPKPVDEAPPAEIRGGNRPSDFVPTENPFHAPFEGWSDAAKEAWLLSHCDSPDDELAEDAAQPWHGGPPE